jgi:exonuclease III
LQEDVKQVVSTFKADIICLQETKIPYFNLFVIKSVLGPYYGNN